MCWSSEPIRQKFVSRILCSNVFPFSFFLSNHKWVELPSQTANIKFNYSLKNKQEATPQLYCTSNGGSGDDLCYLWWMLSTCILRAVCLHHLSCLSLVLWCAGSADKQRCETLSAHGNLLRMKLKPFLCQPGAHGEDDGREAVRGTNTSKLYLDSKLLEGTRSLWDWEVCHFQG